MIRLLAASAAMGAAGPSQAAGPAAPRRLEPSAFPVREHLLPNGMKVLLLPEHSVPTVTYYTFFRVGSRNERTGITGISHLFEHMMFNGAAKYGPKEFDRQLEARGGYSNAYTSNDVTAYYEDFDRDALALVVDLESDRMRSLSLTAETLASEREVVKEERRYRVDNDIGGLVDEELDALAFVAHPYHWPVIGWMGDLDRIAREDCVAYFRTYYAPNNAVLIIVGDFEPDEALALVSKAYADIPRGPPPPAVAAYEPEQRGERTGRVHHPAQAPMLELGYKAVAGTHADAAALDVVQAALSVGEGGRLHRSLVREQEVATSVGASFEWRVDPGLFKVSMELAPGADPRKAVAALDAELARFQSAPPPEAELSRAKNILRGQFLRGLATHNGRAHAMGEFEILFGSWKAMFDVLDRYEKVTPEQAQAAARRYLVPSRRTVVELVPDPGAAKDETGDGAGP